MSETGYRNLRQLSVKRGGGTQITDRSAALLRCWEKNNAEKMWDMKRSDREFVSLFDLHVNKYGRGKLITKQELWRNNSYG